MRNIRNTILRLKGRNKEVVDKDSEGLSIIDDAPLSVMDDVTELEKPHDSAVYAQMRNDPDIQDAIAAVEKEHLALSKVADPVNLEPAPHVDIEIDEPSSIAPSPVLDETVNVEAPDTTKKAKTSKFSFLGGIRPLNQKVENNEELERVAAAPINEDRGLKFKNPLSVLKNTFSAVDEGSQPIRVVIGYLPDVSERDALEYSEGIAEKMFDQLGIAYYDVYPYEAGYVYEIQEGGRGLGHSQAIIEYFNQFPEFDLVNPPTVVLSTATRKVEVQRMRRGLVAVFLPEDDPTPITEGLEFKHKMVPAMNKRTGFLVVSAVFFILTFFSMLISGIAQRQPYIDAPAAGIDRLAFSQLPSSKWSDIVNAGSQGKQVKALRFKDGKWQPVETN